MPFGIIIAMTCITGGLVYSIDLITLGKPNPVCPDKFDRMLVVRDTALVNLARADGRMGPPESLFSKISTNIFGASKTQVGLPAPHTPSRNSHVGLGGTAPDGSVDQPESKPDMYRAPCPSSY
jgi:hypothetical protein